MQEQGHHHECCYAKDESQDGIKSLHDVGRLVAHHFEIVVDRMLWLIKCEHGIDDLVHRDYAEPRNLCDEPEGEDGILRVAQVEQGHQDYQLQGVDCAPEHLDWGGQENVED